MAKILTRLLRNVAEKYGILSGGAGMSTLNTEEGVTYVHELGHELTGQAARYFSYTVAHNHVAAGGIEILFDPGGELNILGDFEQSERGGSLGRRWNRAEEDLWVLGVTSAIPAVSGLVAADAASMFDPGSVGAALSPGTQIPTNFLLGRFQRNTGLTPTQGGLPKLLGIETSTFAAWAPITFPWKVPRSTTGRFLTTSVVSGSGTLTWAFNIYCVKVPIGSLIPGA